jgi:hypothetical protein
MAIINGNALANVQQVEWHDRPARKRPAVTGD